MGVNFVINTGWKLGLQTVLEILSQLIKKKNLELLLSVYRYLVFRVLILPNVYMDGFMVCFAHVCELAGLLLLYDCITVIVLKLVSYYLLAHSVLSQCYDFVKFAIIQKSNKYTQTPASLNLM